MISASTSMVSMMMLSFQCASQHDQNYITWIYCTFLMMVLNIMSQLTVNCQIIAAECVCVNFVFVAAHRKESFLDKHLQKCQLHSAQRVRMPEVYEEKSYFTKIECQERLPFIIYADFESILEFSNVQDRDISKPWTERYETHIPCSFGMHTVSSDKRFYSPPKICFVEDSAERFIDTVQREARIIRKYLKTKIPMKRLTPEAWRNYNTAPSCRICKKELTEASRRVRDHNHLTGKFRGAAHSNCNYNINPSQDTRPIFPSAVCTIIGD